MPHNDQGIICEDGDDVRGTCRVHSGITTKLNGGLALLVCILSLLGYQTFFQVPQLRLDTTKAQVALEARILALETADLLSVKDREGLKSLYNNLAQQVEDLKLRSRR